MQIQLTPELIRAAAMHHAMIDYCREVEPEKFNNETERAAMLKLVPREVLEIVLGQLIDLDDAAIETHVEAALMLARDGFARLVNAQVAAAGGDAARAA